jgi:hypothetical protein
MSCSSQTLNAFGEPPDQLDRSECNLKAVAVKQSSQPQANAFASRISLVSTNMLECCLDVTAVYRAVEIASRLGLRSEKQKVVAASVLLASRS